jgi:hypothetical protein
VVLAAVLASLLLAGGFIRPVRVAWDHGDETLWLWAWQTGRIEFVNSVTQRPVAIDFGLPWRFSGFSARTDPGTEEYYTAGGFAWNERLARERTRVIEYCSEVGVRLTLGRKTYPGQAGCLRVFLLWPP